MLSWSIVSNSLWPFRLLCPWDFSGKNIRGGCHFLLQGVFLTQRSNSHLLCLLHKQLSNSCLNIILEWVQHGYEKNGPCSSLHFIEAGEEPSLWNGSFKNGHGENFLGHPVVWPLLSLLRAWIWPLVGELKSHKLCSVAKRKKKKQTKLRGWGGRQGLCTRIESRSPAIPQTLSLGGKSRFHTVSSFF